MLTPSRGNIRKRGPILRVRTGCLTCRARKKKCDESKPICAGCRRNKLTCQWPTPQDNVRPSDMSNVSPHHDGNDQHPSSMVADTEATASKSMDFEAVIRTTPPAEGSSSSSSSASQSSTPGWEYFPAAPSSTAGLGNAPRKREGSSTSQDDEHETVEMKREPGTSSSTSDVLYRTQPYFPPQHSSRTEAIFKSLSMVPDLEDRSFELLNYYLSRTAMSMFNGSTESNPFIDQLVPLSFANNFILRLLLSQSASHRAITESDSKGLAQKDYIMSLRLFQNAIDDYVSGRESSPLWVAMGALIMCFTETAKGDVQGVIFEHLNATGPLLTELVLNPKFAIRDDLKAFILEYYVYTASMSMISVDPTLYESPFIRPELEYQAQQLANTGYTGPLCGCWLPLLLLIPRIFELGRRSLAVDIKPPFPTPDDFVTFSLLQSQILAFIPPAPPNSDVAICGYVHQHALHLYLLTCLVGNRTSRGLHSSYIDTSLEQAFYYLDQLSPVSRVHTSIGWALAVIGSCTVDASRQNKLRTRLDTMFHTLGLGNIRATTAVLEYVWAMPVAERSPWTLCRVMQEHQIWISFA